VRSHAPANLPITEILPRLWCKRSYQKRETPTTESICGLSSPFLYSETPNFRNAVLGSDPMKWRWSLQAPVACRRRRLGVLLPPGRLRRALTGYFTSHLYIRTRASKALAQLPAPSRQHSRASASGIA